MSIDFQAEGAGNAARNSGNAGGNNNSSNNNVGGNNSSASGTGAGNLPASSSSSSLSSARKDEPTENGTDTPESLTPRVKREPEPTPSTSAQGRK